MATEVKIHKSRGTGAVVENIDSGTETAMSEVVLKRYKTVMNGLPRGGGLLARVSTEAISELVEDYYSCGSSVHF